MNEQLDRMEAMLLTLVDTDDKARELELLRAFHGTWILAEPTRGCYSCCDSHDCRCPKSRNIPGDCACYRDQLEKLDAEIHEARHGKLSKEK